MDSKTFTKLDLPHLPPAARRRFYGTTDSFKEAWSACSEPRPLLALVSEALRLSQDNNGAIRLGQVLDLVVDMINCVWGDLEQAFPEGTRVRFLYFLDVCRACTVSNKERVEEPEAAAASIFPGGRGAYEAQTQGCVIPALLVTLIDSLTGVASRTNRRRFEPATESDAFADALSSLSDTMMMLDLLARALNPLSVDARLEILTDRVRSHFRGLAILDELTKSHPTRRPERWMSLFFHTKVDVLAPCQTAYATLHDPASDVVLARVDRGRQITLIDADLRVTVTEIRPQAQKTVVRIVTSRPVVLKHRVASVQSRTPSEDPITHTTPALPLWG